MHLQTGPHGDTENDRLHPTEGANKGKTYLGLYDFKEGRLWFCYRGPESTRPKNFNDKPNNFSTFEPTPKK
jgi:hypothetical protein